MSQLTCGWCREPLRARDVDFERLRARCRACGWELGTGRGTPYRVGRGAAASDDEEAEEAEELEERPTMGRRERVDVPLPSTLGVRSERRPDGERQLVVIMRWRAFRPIPLQLATLVLLLVFVVASVVSATTSLGPLPLVAGALVAIALAVGHLVLTFVNRATLTIGREQMAVQHGPIPWPPRTVDLTGVTQLWVDEGGASRGGGTYHLLARRHGRVERLWRNFVGPHEPLYLEQRLESFLRIEDEAVLDEYEPSFTSG